MDSIEMRAPWPDDNARGESPEQQAYYRQEARAYFLALRSQAAR